MNRRTLLAAAAAACIPANAAAQSFNFAAGASYSAARRGVSVLVMQRGAVVFEDYANGGGAARGWELASGVKSFCGVIAAAAIQDRLIRDWDEPCAETLTEWAQDDRRAITLRHLLSLTSGLGGGPIGRPPPYAEAIRAAPVAAPGARFAYGPTPFQIFGEIMRRKLEGDPRAYLQRRVFDHLSIAPTFWRNGADGNPVMPSGAGFTARDWARFGWFVLQRGEGRVDADALAQCFVGTEPNPGYGLTWWLMREGLVTATPNTRTRVDAELSARYGGISMAAGAGNQRLYLLPAIDTVIVRQATGILEAMRNPQGDDWSDAEFLRALLNA